MDNNEKILNRKKVLEFMCGKGQSDLIEVLHLVQNTFGYIPKNIVVDISKTLDIPVSKIYGVITFYSRFSLIPKGKYSISVCMGTACYVKGSKELLKELCSELEIKPGETTEDGLFSIVETRCIGACGLAPLVSVNKDVHGRLKKDDIKGIIDEYRNRG